MATIQLTFSYENTEDTRIYELEIDDSLSTDAKEKILEINESLKAGTDNGLSSFFVSETADNLKLISAAKFTVTEEEYLDLTPTT